MKYQNWIYQASELPDSNIEILSFNDYMEYFEKNMKRRNETDLSIHQRYDGFLWCKSRWLF